MAKAWQCFIGLGLLLASLQGAVLAQQTPLDRIEALQALSEKDNADALNQLVALSPSMGSITPYAVRRDYLNALIGVQVDAAKMGDADATIAKLQALAQENKDDIGMVLATSRAASMMALAGKSEAAIVKLTAIEPIAFRTANPQALWNFYSALGNAQLTVGRFELALASALKGLQFAKEHTQGETAAHMRSLNLIANVYMAMTNWDKALQVVQEGLVIATEAGSVKLAGTFYLNQGAIFTSLGRAKPALESYEKALKIGQQAGLVGLQGTALNNIGDGYLIAKNYPKAEVYARQALLKFRRPGKWGVSPPRKAMSGLP